MKRVDLAKWKEPIAKLTNELRESSPTILTMCGCMGLVTTVGLTIKATVDATNIMKEHEDEVNQIPQKRYRVMEAARLSWKCYIPVAISGGVSLGCIIGANRINLKRNAALVAAYVASEDKLKHCEGKIFDKITEKTDSDKSSDDTSEKDIEKARSLVVNGEECMCRDEFSGRIFKTSLSKIQSAESNLSKRLASEYSVTVNDLYEELDIDILDIGNEYGWNLEQGDQIDIRIDAEVDEKYGPMMTISYEPKHYWDNRD